VGFGAVGVVGCDGEVEYLVRVEDVEQCALGLDGCDDRVELLRPDRRSGQRPAVGVAQPDGLRAANGQRLDRRRRRTVHLQVREVLGVGGIGHPDRGGPPPLCRHADSGVVQGGSAAQRRQAVVGVGDLEEAAGFEVQVQPVAGHTPPPRLGVVNRRCEARRGNRFGQRPGDCPGVACVSREFDGHDSFLPKSV
jgi:hypothetical protein